MNNKEEMRKNYKKKLGQKTEVLYNVAISQIQFYEGYKQNQIDSLETLIGAQLFYLNKCKEFNYSGQISEKAKKARDKSEPITREHFNPRMSSGKELMAHLKENMENEKEDDMDWIIEKYINEWGQYHFTTAKENRELRRAYKKPAKKPADWSQKKYDNWEKAKTWEKAYYSAGIILTKDTK